MNTKILGENLKKLRLAENLSQIQFANLIGANQALVSKIENGKGGGLHVFCEMINFFKERGYPLSDFFDEYFVADNKNIERIKTDILTRKLEILKEEIDQSFDSIFKHL